MPGGDKLAEEIGVGRDTIEVALRKLEAEGILLNQGRRKSRAIIAHTAVRRDRKLRLAILRYERDDQRLGYIMRLEHQLSDAGYQLLYTPKCLWELEMDTEKVIRMAEETKADAWIVMGASREILQWFADSKIPVIAMFGRRRELPIASVGPSKDQAIKEATHELISLGHTRIVLIARKMRRLPKPGEGEQAFLDTLEAHGIAPSPYHLPDWEETTDGFYQRLESLFQLTPPTALIIDEVSFFVSAQQFLASRQLRVPEDVSLICTDYDDIFEWYRPRISHIKWSAEPVIRRIVRWANNISRGKKDFKQTYTPAEFVEGETIGVVRP